VPDNSPWVQGVSSGANVFIWITFDGRRWWIAVYWKEGRSVR